MPIQCPTCSRVNPANASYCFYDGRSLVRTGVQGATTAAPAGLGTRPFPLPFSFSDGQGCANFNQLVLACDQRWSEARANLLNGTWQSFFSAIGRVDLAALALQASREPDHDVGLCRLLEGLPADSEALRPPKLGLPSLVENLSGLEPGKDHKFQLVIQNQGSLLLSGSVTTDCDWLCFGDRQGRSTSKLFQTRDSFTVSVWVAGNKLRAAKIPYEGKIHVDTNGGRQAVLVVAKVPLRPFPKGNVLSGATTPRELATKARQHAKEAAVLFEQGMVKAWYEGNGWIYPIQGPQAQGAGALQQFFEALGLTKPPKLSINTQRIDCKGEEGTRITKNVVLSTEEAKIVHAVGHSNQPWVKVLPGKGQGKSLTIPLSIEVPATPGETVHASVTFVGNGQQQFVVPISLTVEGLTPQQAEEEEKRGKRRELLYAGVGLGALLVVGLGVALFLRGRSGGGDNGEVVDNTQKPPDVVAPPPPVKGKAWWDSIAGTNLPASFEKLRQAAGAQSAVLDAVTAERDLDRSQAYKQLSEKLTELWRNPAARGPLAQFVTECCVHEPSALALDSLRRAVADQFPVEDREYPDDKCEDIDRANFWLAVVFDAMGHKAANRDRNRDLTSELVRVLDFDPDPGIPLNDLKDQAQKALAVLCYHNTLPTAEKSVDHALTVREALLVRFGPQLPPNMREQDDVRLLALGLTKGSDLWPKLRPIFEACVKSNEIGVAFKIVDLYAKAPGDLVPHMEDALKTRWRAAGNPKLNRAAKVDAMRNSIASAARAAKIKPQQRLAQLQGLVGNRNLSAARPEGPQPNASLLDTVHLAHASTMASLLTNKDAEVGRFDDLVANLPSFDSDKPMPEVKKPDDKPRKTEGLDVIEVVAGIKILKGEPLTNKNEVDPRRGSYRRSFLAHLRAGEVYIINMESTDFTPYLRLETLAGKEQYHAKGANAQITYQPVEEADYRIIASSLDKGGTGTFTIKITHQQKPVYRFGFRGRPFGPPGPFGGPPGVEDNNNQNQGNSGAVDRKAAEVSQGDLNDLASKQSTARMAAFKNLAGSVPNDLAYRHAIKMASYLLTEPWVAAELTSATEALPSLSRCARLYQALSDVIAKGEKLNFERTVAIVGAILEQPQLRFDQDDPNWRASCRKLLLNRCLDLTEPAKPATNPADKAADLLRDLYKEQGLAFGLDSPDFEDETHLTAVLERLIKHVAGKNAEAKINRELQAMRFSVANDLEHVVLLQRLWLQVLIKALHDQAPDDARQQLLELPRQLDAADSKFTSLLDQLRAGEQTILRAWALTRNLRVK